MNGNLAFESEYEYLQLDNCRAVHLMRAKASEHENIFKIMESQSKKLEVGEGKLLLHWMERTRKHSTTLPLHILHVHS